MTSALVPSVPSHRMAHGTPMAAVRTVLAWVDDLPPGATGALEFDDGLILVENRRVCWAMSHRLRKRLTDILRYHSDPPMDQQTIDAVLLECRGGLLPIGETLVRSGLVTDAQLGASLRQQIAESICMLAESPKLKRWMERQKAGYDARYTFSTVQVLCSVGALRAPETARSAREQLKSVLSPEARGVSFIRHAGSSAALLLAEVRCENFTTEQVLALCDWSMGLFDVSTSITENAMMVIGTWQAGIVVTAWQTKETMHVVVCEGPAFAVVATRVSDSKLRAAAPAQEGALAREQIGKSHSRNNH